MEAIENVTSEDGAGDNERDDWDDMIVRLKKDVDRLHAEVERMQEALEFYANESNYETTGAPMHPVTRLWDMGKYAREALAAQKEKNDG